MNRLQTRVDLAKREIKRLREKIEKATNLNGVIVDDSLHQDLSSVMNEHNDSIEKQFPEGTFRGLFWQEQLKAAKVKDARQMRWHPTMIKWCLNLKLLSSSAYHSLRTGGFIKLPSERTLREYTHYFKSKTGFQAEVDQMLTEEVSLHGSSEWQSYLVILFDEMKVRESLVYDKHTCELIGFTKLGDLNDQLDLLERSDVEHPTIANHILGVMVRGVFTSLRFPYAHFPTTDTTGAKLYSIVWEAIERLERLQLKVVAVTADGASPNRKFFSMHSCSKSDVCYKTPNPYTKEDRHIYFFSDVPHLMKTTRNCWSHSFSNNNTRKLWVRINFNSCKSVPNISFHLYLCRSMASISVGLISCPCMMQRFPLPKSHKAFTC